MVTILIIVICCLLLTAYLFDLASAKTRIPSVIPLLITGWLTRQATSFFHLEIPDISTLLPLLGTVGLILIVLEGSLELEISRLKRSLIIRSFLLASLPLIILALILTGLFTGLSGESFRDCLISAIPLCVISSAIAIPSTINFEKQDREFVIYESSFSDIIGVLLFNFIALNNSIDVSSLWLFLIQFGSIIVISFTAAIGLSYLLRKIEHHVKFIPILILIILIYTISKAFHLPALVFILLFGLFLGNLDKIKTHCIVRLIDPENLHAEVRKFKDIVLELTFVVRSLFFLLFGFMIETSELLDPVSLLWAVSILLMIFIIRFIAVRLSGLPEKPLAYIAPRGLITILLFLSIPETGRIPFMNKPLVIQVILFTVIVMMIGVMKGGRNGAISESERIN